MIELKITAQSGEDLATQVAELAKTLGLETNYMIQMELPLPAPVKTEDKPEVKPEPETKKKKRGRPAAKETQPEPKQPEPQPEPQPQPEPKQPEPQPQPEPQLEFEKRYTIDDCRNLIGDVATKHGVTMCLEIIRSFGVDQVAKLDPKNYAAFCQKCEALL